MSIISVSNLSKAYRIGKKADRTDSFVGMLQDSVMAPFRNWRRMRQPTGESRDSEDELYWALRDVSFEVREGEVLGVIGRNGAGKSTLLKILSRITEPTSGEVRIRGRVASLLEVGTGFHPELTGRENVYLNGTILGMHKAEIDRKFDEIVDFSGVEKFLDTPVKRYSSGMKVRLAFAVAAHLDPEILIVDEVLAVGDAEFQKKCLGKMKDVAQGGRTVLFVSHNMAAVSSLTRSVVVLKNGCIEYVGSTSDGIERYLGSQSTKQCNYRPPQRQRGHQTFISEINIVTKYATTTHISGDELRIQFMIEHSATIEGACLSFQLVNQSNQPVVHCWLYDVDVPFCRGSGPTKVECLLPNLSLNVGTYSVTCYLTEPPGGAIFEVLESVCRFDVVVMQKQTLFGWRADACTYLAEFKWSTEFASETDRAVS